jgi:hypothetical protein
MLKDEDFEFNSYNFIYDFYFGPLTMLCYFGPLEEGQFCPFELFFSESASSNPIQQ